jgi:hypothetical protein
LRTSCAEMMAAAADSRTTSEERSFRAYI